MSKEVKKDFSDVDYRFSFILTINDNTNQDDIIIVKRDFNIYNIDEESLCSLELKECVDDIVSLIDSDLKSKSRVYCHYNYDENYVTSEFSTPLSEKSKTDLKFSFYDRNKLVISKIWSGDGYPFAIRNSIDLTNKKYKAENLKNVELDFSKQILKKASADKQDLTTVIMKMLSGVCVSFKQKNGSKLIYRPVISDIHLDNLILNDMKGSVSYVKPRLEYLEITHADNSALKFVYNNYNTKYSVGDKTYDLNIKNSYSK